MKTNRRDFLMLALCAPFIDAYRRIRPSSAASDFPAIYANVLDRMYFDAYSVLGSEQDCI